ncbi:MAG: hypothetical protein M1832_001916 [Thelocarpon impressellum]|nr:MAG: hypothetical protein M1832_001916 [Thelocarpon impressellum]
MRLFLIPISTHRTLLYCRRLNQGTSPQQTTYIDKATTRAARLWAQWERGDRRWQARLTEWGNSMLQRIPYEEWGLKSVPPLTSARRKAIEERAEPVDVSFPASLIPRDRLGNVLRQLATERQALHRKRLWWSIVGMPISAPVALIPVIPNIPFFYLVFRAWSHWRALSGSKHVELLLDKGLIEPAPSAVLDALYQSTRKDRVQGEEKGLEAPLLTEAHGAFLAKALDVPELGPEIERAVRQVRGALKPDAETKEDKQEETVEVGREAKKP